ncbi:MAG: hypothetical protein WB586_03605 [Chthoniobacterales bacterium]
MRRGLLLIALGLAACSSPKLHTAGTAADQFAALHGNGEKGIAKTFYDLGQSDAAKSLYWAQRRAQETGDPPPQKTSLERKYVVLPVPEHTAPDGTQIEANQQVVEVVQ